jgi:hypothetical protein
METMNLFLTARDELVLRRERMLRLEDGKRKKEKKNAEQEKKREDAARTALKEKERGCTVRLFETNSLKKGAV